MSDNCAWAYDWEDRAFTLGFTSVHVEEQLTEFEDERLAQRHVLALARVTKTNEEVMLRITYEWVDRAVFLCNFLFASANT